jgi:hypothetical protein
MKSAASVLRIKDSSTLNMEAAGPFKMLVMIYQTTWRHIPENRIFTVTTERISNPTGLFTFFILFTESHIFGIMFLTIMVWTGLIWLWIGTSGGPL